MKKYTLWALIKNQGDEKQAFKDLQAAMRTSRTRLYDLLKAEWTDGINASTEQLVLAAKHFDCPIEDLINPLPEEMLQAA